MTTQDIKVTGTPQTYGDGAIRNTKEGKGRFDLIPNEVFFELRDYIFNNPGDQINYSKLVILDNIAHDEYLFSIIALTIFAYSKQSHEEKYFISIKEFENCCWEMFKDLAVHFQKGAEIYGERNCEKGIPLWSFKDSAMRHTVQYFNNECDEPHLISAIWNLWMAEWTLLKEEYNITQE